MFLKAIISFLLLCSTLFSGRLFCQAEQDTDAALRIIGARFHRSFNIQYTRQLKDEIKLTKPWCLEADMNWHLRTKNTRDLCNCYPRLGVAFRYTNFDMPGVLGSALGFYPFVEPYLRPQKPLSFAVRYGTGPVYVTRIYDEVSNPDNRFIGSHICFLSVLSLSGNYALSKRVNLRLAANFNHISNAGYASPNRGINYLSVNAGFDYSFDEPEFREHDTDPEAVLPDRKNRFDVIALFSLKPVSSDDLYPVYGAVVNYSRRMSGLFSLCGGLEWINVQSLRKDIEQHHLVNQDGNLPDHNKIGALTGIEWHFGRFIFSQQFGYFLYAPYREEGSWYQRYGLTFYLTDHIFSGINIKAYGQDAGFMDVRMGFSL